MNNPEIPLHLCQVLEEEFESLKSLRNLSDGGLNITPPEREDWLFHEGHVNIASLADELWTAKRRWEAAHAGWPAPSGDALRREPDLRTYLAFRYPGLLEAETTEREFLDTLNQILLEPNDPEKSTFRKLRFEQLPLSEETLDLMRLGWPGEKISFRVGRVAGACDERPVKWCDLVLFRRLLLEDALRGHINSVYDKRLEAVYARIHALEPKRAALCFSGGGIRSGTFALGVVQSLAGRRRLLQEFDYLSTVSGGGYTGGWLSAWIHRHRDGLDGVAGELNGSARRSKLEPEPEPLQHLREYSSFVTPRTGLLSADTWTFVVIYVRNLLLNWVVLIPLLASVLLIPRVANAVVVVASPDWRLLWKLIALGGFGLSLLMSRRKFWLSLLATAAGASLAYLVGARGWLSTHEEIRGAILVAGTLAGGYALAYMRLSRPSNTGTIRPGSVWDTNRNQRRFLWMCMLPMTLAAVLLTTFWAWLRHAAGHSSEKVVKCVGFGLSASARSSECLRLPVVGEVGEFKAFLLYGLTLGLLGWLIYVALAALSWVRVPKRVNDVRSEAEKLLDRIKALLTSVGTLFGLLKNGLGEMAITMVTSGLGSVLLYAAATKIPVFYDPVFEFDGTGRFADRSAEIYTWLAFPTYLFVFFLSITLFVGFTSRRSDKSPSYLRRRRRGEFVRTRDRLRDWLLSPFDRVYVEDEDREWLARASAWVFIVAGCWLVLGGLVLFGPLLYIPLGAWLAGAGGASGLTSLLGGKSSKTPGRSKAEGPRGWIETLGLNLIVVAAFVFFACIIIAVSLLTGTVVAWLATYFAGFPRFVVEALGGVEHLGKFAGRYPSRSAEGEENILRVLRFPSWQYLLMLSLALQIFGRCFSRVVNLNKFSLHAGYRDRIIRAFLGASRPRGERKQNPFTGFDPRDNLNMEEMRPWLLRESDFYGPPDKLPPGALRRFVEELSRAPEELSKASGAAKQGGPSQPEDIPARRLRVAAFVRDCISRTGGDSQRYFKDPACSIDTNASFRSALFADLNNILQSYDLDVASRDEQTAERVHVLAEAAASAGRPSIVMDNRRLLHTLFADCINHPPRPYRLMHVVNMALNLVGGDKLAWQQRRAESFTATPLHSGSLFVGYRRTRDYGGRNGISLGTAVATSGAAASSNMGYFSPSVFVTFVLTFFNARLGWWLGNPGVHGAETFYRSHPEKALSPIIDEAFGLTDDRNPYVLLSDGGHFENLGLYEMVLRRCRYIFVVDGSADPSGSYDDLGGAVRKIRIDFGIRIEFNKGFQILSRPESLDKKSGAYCAVGDILYGDADGPRGDAQDAQDAREKMTGKLIYIKPAVYGDEPRDVFNYTKGHEDFPHESTADQFFDEPQFESHRMLGFHILEKLFGDAPTPETLAEFVSRLEGAAREASKPKTPARAPARRTSTRAPKTSTRVRSGSNGEVVGEAPGVKPKGGV